MQKRRAVGAQFAPTALPAQQKSMNIALLLSGGVDSAVATHLLMERGLRPDLFYIKIGMDNDDELTCTAEEDLELCQAIARRYGLPLQTIDLQK